MPRKNDLVNQFLKAVKPHAMWVRNEKFIVDKEIIIMYDIFAAIFVFINKLILD